MTSFDASAASAIDCAMHGGPLDGKTFKSKRKELKRFRTHHATDSLYELRHVERSSTMDGLVIETCRHYYYIENAETKSP